VEVPRPVLSLPDSSRLPHDGRAPFIDFVVAWRRALALTGFQNILLASIDDDDDDRIRRGRPHHSPSYPRPRPDDTHTNRTVFLSKSRKHVPEGSSTHSASIDVFSRSEGIFARRDALLPGHGCQSLKPGANGSVNQSPDHVSVLRERCHTRHRILCQRKGDDKQPVGC